MLGAFRTGSALAVQLDTEILASKAAKLVKQ